MIFIKKSYLAVAIIVLSQNLHAANYEQNIDNVFDTNPFQINEKEYKKEEISRNLFYFRRWSFITVGAFPISFLLSSFVYDMSKYLFYYNRIGTDANKYSPFIPSNVREPYNLTENLSIIGVSIGISSIIALIDHLILKKKIQDGFYEVPYDEGF